MNDGEWVTEDWADKNFLMVVSGGDLVAARLTHT